MNIRQSCFVGVVLTLLLLVGCGTSGLGGIMGGGQTDVPIRDELRGTVDQIDLRDQFIVLSNVDTTATTSRLVDRDTRTRVYFDDRTSVDYQGNTYRPEDLEQGDRVAARVERSGERLLATSMTVLYDVSGSSDGPRGTPITQVRGTVQDVSTSGQTIEIDPAGSDSIVTVQYDAHTYVEHDGRRYYPGALNRGDEIDVDVKDLGSGRLLAEGIHVVRSVRGERNRSALSTVRGTVHDIDMDRQTIELEQTGSGGSAFTSGSGNILMLQYDANTIVEYQGNRYDPVHLERGDFVEVEVEDLGTRQVAQRITVVRDVRSRR